MISREHTSGVAQFLEWNANSISLGSPSGNTFQPDVSFRGFAASPLLGTPQGLSVFQDGVRINEAFADVVNWDLLPQNAIASMQLLPGSNPVFGLNTLGGALALSMKDGFRSPGIVAEAYGGSFGRSFPPLVSSSYTYVRSSPRSLTAIQRPDGSNGHWCAFGCV